MTLQLSNLTLIFLAHPLPFMYQYRNADFITEDVTCTIYYLRQVLLTVMVMSFHLFMSQRLHHVHHIRQTPDNGQLLNPPTPAGPPRQT